MNGLELFAKPWWVNVLILVPPAAYWAWRRHGLALRPGTLFAASAFGIGFGYVEAAVVVYLRAASGLLPGYGGVTLPQGLVQVPEKLLAIEVIREAATMVMLVAVALLAARTWRERGAIFLWVFAAWDIFYYVGLWFTVHWPPSLRTSDILFLIPVPWVSPVWFPILVSMLMIAAILLARKAGANLLKA